MDEKFLKPYDPEKTEDAIYARWEKSGFFNPDVCADKGVCKKDAEQYSIILPPPNVTGTLHMGHSAMLAIQDILIRYNRMLGKKTLWLPGTDHAAMATQSKVEKDLLKKDKKNRHDFGRDKFLSLVEEFAKASHDTIVGQIKKMGSSVDWSREAFTLDEKRRLAVNTAFKKMYDGGLIYRGHRVVNWDPKGQTTVSDEEVKHEATKGLLYTFRYSKDFPIAVATTRPETKLGDTAVAVHPDDNRYKKYVGKEYVVDFVGIPLKLKVVADKCIDPEFGTGAVGVTPAHSMTDFEIRGRHDLPLRQVINEYGRMMISDPELKDKKTIDARGIIIDRLKDAGLLEKEEEIDQNISKADRSGGTIEPLPKLQWFIDVDKKFILKNSKIESAPSGSETTLKDLMLLVVNNKLIKITPERFEKIYFHWINNLRPWCISRQIWYGHRIPVWYKGDEIYCGVTPPAGIGWEQDPDTLDTWFSSGLWTFSTLGWPEDTSDLKTFHPTSLMETGYDILFFWVARMILMSTYFLGDIPFKNIYLHGLVLDSKGKKMSKSVGNIIDPLDMILKYGADATRLSLIIGTSPGKDLSLSEDKIRAYKKFANKIWNASRFVLEQTTDIDYKKEPTLAKRDLDIISELNKLINEISDHLNKFSFNLAGEALYHYFWHRFADIIIEESKKRLESNNKEDSHSCRWTLLHVMRTNLILLHPFMPFVTEEIWSSFSDNGSLLIVTSWPKPYQ